MPTERTSTDRGSGAAGILQETAITHDEPTAATTAEPSGKTQTNLTTAALPKTTKRSRAGRSGPPRANVVTENAPVLDHAAAEDVALDLPAAEPPLAATLHPEADRASSVAVAATTPPRPNASKADQPETTKPLPGSKAEASPAHDQPSRIAPDTGPGSIARTSVPPERAMASRASPHPSAASISREARSALGAAPAIAPPENLQAATAASAKVAEKAAGAASHDPDTQTTTAATATPAPEGVPSADASPASPLAHPIVVSAVPAKAQTKSVTEHTSKDETNTDVAPAAGQSPPDQTAIAATRPSQDRLPLPGKYRRPEEAKTYALARRRGRTTHYRQHRKTTQSHHVRKPALLQNTPTSAASGIYGGPAWAPKAFGTTN